MRFIFALALGVLLSTVVAYTVLGIIRLARLLARSDIFAVTVTVVVLLVLSATVPRVVLIPPGSQEAEVALTTSSTTRSVSSTGTEAQEKIEGLQPLMAPGGIRGPRSAESVKPGADLLAAANPSGQTEPNRTGDFQPDASIATETRTTGPASLREESSQPQVAEVGPRHLVQAASRESAAATGTATAVVAESDGKRKEKSQATQWDKFQRADWMEKRPFYLEDGQALAWPLVLGPYIESTDPVSIGELRRKLSGAWFYWLVEEAPKRTSPDLGPTLFSWPKETGKERPWERRIRWFPPELWEDLVKASQEAIARYAKEEFGKSLTHLPDPNWIAENLVRDMYWEVLQPTGTSRPVVLDPAEAAGAGLALEGEPVRFRVHVLLGFDREARNALADFLRQLKVRDRVARLAQVMAALTGTFALCYVGVRSERRLGGKKRRLLWTAIALGCALCALGAIRAFVG